MSDFDNKSRNAAGAPAGGPGGSLPRAPRPVPPRPGRAAAPEARPAIVDPETLDPGFLEDAITLAPPPKDPPAGAAADSGGLRPLDDKWSEPGAALESADPNMPPAPASLAWDDEDEVSEEQSEDDPYVGTTLDRYVVDELIGEGGMGKVYLAHHKVIGKKVAIKILHNELAKDSESVGRFVREAKAASSIGNPHIVDISDFGEAADGSTYFVMEFLDGSNLADLIEEKGSLPADMVVDVALQLCDGLSAAHQQEIVHRDLKPDNITLIKHGKSNHFCKILDFGIAKVSTSASSTKLTIAGAVFGTPHYMSPEQAAGDTVDRRTDVYSLGVIMYEMTAGELPFNADNFMGILTQHMYKAPVPIRALVGAPECPPGLEAIILKTLSKKKEARYQTMDALAADLRKFKNREVPDAVHDMMERSGSFNVPADYFKTGTAVVAASPKGPRPGRWGPRLVAIMGVLVAVGITLFVMFKDSITTAQPPEPAPALEEPPAVPGVEVLLASEPAEAKAYLRDQVLQLPSVVPVADGEIVRVKVVADGFAEREVELDGTQPRVVVKLTSLAPAASASATEAATSVQPPVRPRPASGKPKTSPKPGDVVDPWAGK